ncbi:MAG: hypothetical protein ACFFBH_10270 [Promethearchaeota archaeon]
MVKNKILVRPDIIKNGEALLSVLPKALLNFSSKSTVINYVFRNLGFTDSHDNVILFPFYKYKTHKYTIIFYVFEYLCHKVFSAS